MAIIAIYPSHDSSIAVYFDGQFRIFELERLKKERFYRFDNKDDFKETYNQLKQIIKKECNIDSFQTCLHLQLPESHQEYLKEIFGIQEFIFCGHHLSHAACSFYQSSFNKALIFTVDGGGYEGEDDQDNRVTFFNIYLGDREAGLTKLKTIKYDLGTSYGLCALPIKEISKTEEDWGSKFLSFAGKFMALASLGIIKEEWKGSLRKFFKSHKSIDVEHDFRYLKHDLGLDKVINSLEGQKAYDFAATAQCVFEEIIWEEIEPFINQYDLPICLSGGCALNIIFNQKLVERVQVPVFIPPNPSDCGLAFGMLANYLKPKESPELMYSGFPILDIDKLDDYVKEYKASKYTLQEIAELLDSGNIIGVVRGNSEHGPRALGNRSIICDPSYPWMKDALNLRIKNRESWRPFAALIRLEDINKYFYSDLESKYMLYSPKVRLELRNYIPSVVHFDNTSRVQTVDRKDNEFIYDLLSEFEKISEQGVLLNTSFNIKGLPILTTIEDALNVLKTTQLDYVIIEDYLFKKE